MGEKLVSARIAATNCNDELELLLAKVGDGWRVRRSPYVLLAEVVLSIGTRRGAGPGQSVAECRPAICCDPSVPVPPIRLGHGRRAAGYAIFQVSIQKRVIDGARLRAP